MNLPGKMFSRTARHHVPVSLMTRTFSSFLLRGFSRQPDLDSSQLNYSFPLNSILQHMVSQQSFACFAFGAC